MSALKQKTVSGIKWVAINNYARKFLTVTSFIILARILDPKDFGLFAMAFIVIDGFDLFKTFGIDTALIQRKEDVETATHTAFFILPAIGALISVSIFLIAPLSAKLLNEPALINVLRMLGLIFLIGCVGNVPAAILTKEMRFRELAVRDFVSTLSYCIISILFAFLGFGVWSLVYGYIAQRFIKVSLTWVISGYKPKFVFDKKIAFQLIHFGKFIIGASILWFLLLNIDKAVAGRLLGAEMLGYYALAFNISSLVTTHLTSTINQVMFPSYAKIQDDLDDVKRVFLKIFKAISIFCVPFGVGIMLLAPEFIKVVYGQKWIAAIPLLRILAVSSLFSPLFSGTGSLFLACGKPKWNFIGMSVQLIILAVTIAPFIKILGLPGVAISVTASALATIPLYYILMKRLIHLRIQDLFIMLRPALLASFIMLICLLALKSMSASVNVPIFIAMALFGAAIYFITYYIFDKKTFIEFKQLVFSWS